MADTASDLGLDIPELGEETTRIIEQVIPAYGSALNPVDVTAQVINQADDFQKVLAAMVAHPHIHALVIVVTQITGESGLQMARDIVKMSKKSSKPMAVAWTTGDVLVKDQLEILRDGGVQFYKSPARATIAMGRLMKYGAQRDELLSRVKNVASVSVSAEKKAKAQAMLEKAARSMTEHQGKELLELFEIPITKEDVATSEDHAVQIAGKVGYPLALKIDSPDILHKTEAGGLKLNINNDDELKAAYNEVLGNAQKYDPKANINGVLVQEMVKGGTEVIVGVNNDPQFGPTIMFGLGGIFVEILKDVSLRIAPLSREDAIDMIREIKGFKILDGARGREKMDIDAIADVLVKVSQMAVAMEDHIAELDINPLLVLPKGRGVRVADALVIKK